MLFVNRHSPVLMLISLAFFTPLATYVLYRGLRAEWRGRQSRKWPSVNGTIVSAEITAGSGRGLRPEVTYRFTVSRQEYTGNVIQFGLRGGSRGSAEHILAPYMIGSPVLVYYLPDNPRVSVLQPGPYWTTWIETVSSVAWRFT
jgi:hypothetical protein